MRIPTPKQLPSGSWRVQVKVDGRSVSITRATREEAVREALYQKAAAATGRSDTSAASDLTVGEVMRLYIDSRRNILSPSTVRGYTILARTHFTAVRDVKFRSVKNWQTIFNDESLRYSPKSMKNARRFLASAAEYSGFSLPKIQTEAPRRTPKPYLRADQIPTFLDAIRDKPCEIAALLALHSLRRSELLALTTADIDLDRLTISVAASVVPDEENRYIRRETTKNETSTRVVPIVIPRLAELLRALPPGQVVTQNPQTIRKQINRACLAAGLPEVGVHGLRRSFASIAYKAGVSERETMELGGWATPAVMHEHYIQFSRDELLTAEGRLSDFFNSHETTRTPQKIQ